jgi:aminoglycoside 6'-N-acetyltransferase I
MRVALWPGCSIDEELQEIDTILSSGMGGTLPAAIFVAEEEELVTGFLDVGLRSHADGCDPVRPVGFVEGWFVREPWRGRGIGRELMRAAEEWARRHRCQEMASDAPIENGESLRAHEGLGFEVVDRCVHFRRAIQEPIPASTKL